tara:strand:+ start:2892 stop:3062 length:171 start_codon:yes stop_codon:yes gene_type:complete
MKKTITITEKSKVIARLVRIGQNLENATKYANEHYDYVSKHYTGVSKMAEVIMCLD